MMTQRTPVLRLSFLIPLSLLIMLSPSPAAWAADAQWWRGNIHTHSYWSDGDDYPEMIVDWYKTNGYHFLSLSDHNIIARGQKWVDAGGRDTGPAALEKYLKRFGPDWVEQKQSEDGKNLVRLKPLNEYRHWFEEPNRFMLMEGEEINHKTRNKSVHVNATNIVELISTEGGDTVTEAMQSSINAVLAQRERTGQVMFPHINHPNFHWAITAKDIIPLQGDRFFEVYNGHPWVANYGDADHPGTDAIWDEVLSQRLKTDPGHILYGVAVDDAHNYHKQGQGVSNSGRGWIMVKAPHLTPEAIILAMERGDFYASTGVFLNAIEFTNNKLTIKVQHEPGVTFNIQFIGTLWNDTSPGAILHEKKGTSATYTLTGDEIYVRAKVISSRLHPNPYTAGEYETAWSQPVLPQR